MSSVPGEPEAALVAGGEPAAPARRPLAGGGWALLTIAFAMGMGLARTLLVADLVGAHALGVMGIALLAVGTAEAVTSTGVETALVSRRDDPGAELDAAFTLQLARGVLVAAALWVAAPPLASFFAAPEAVPVIRALSAVAVLRGLANPAVALAVRRIEFARVFWWSVPEGVAGFAVAVGVALLRRDVWALVAAVLGAQLVAVATSYALVPRRPRLRLRGVRRLLRYGGWVSGARTLMFLGVNADNAVVGRFLGTSALGIYQLAFRVSELAVVTVARAAGQVALPALSRLRTAAERQREWGAVLRPVLAASCAYAAVVCLLGGPLLERLLGPEWRAAVPVLRILAVAMVFRAVVVVASELFNAALRPQLALQVNALRLAVMLATIFPLMHAFGMQGVAASVLLAGLVAAAMGLYRARSLP